MNIFRKVAVALVTVTSIPLIPVTAAEALHLEAGRGFAQSAPVCRVQTHERLIALTFDDGPDPSFTPAVIDFLRQNNAKATFFVIGEQAAAHPDLINRIHSEGHEIANHTWDHPLLKNVNAEQVRDEAVRTNAVLAPTAPPTLFRAPLGVIDKGQIAAVESLGLRPVHWSSAIDHFVAEKGSTPASAAARLVSEARAGGIILAHDASGARRAEAFEALRIAIPELQREGFTITDASTVLAAGQAVRSRPRTGFWQNGFHCPT